MSDIEDLDLETIIKTAASLSPDSLEKFLSLVPPATRELVLKRLQQNQSTRQPASPTSDKPTVPENATAQPVDIQKTVQREGDRRLLPATIISGDETNEPDTALLSPATTSNVSLVRLYAKGAIGEVFVARDEQLSRELALKRIRPELPHSERRIKRFIREAEITAKLQHPGIVPIYNLNACSNNPNYTMPLVSGSTLSELIKDAHSELEQRTNREGWILKLRPLLTHFIAVCNAIDYAHSQQVLHRDLKPANILIGTQGQTLVLDWGCAKDLDDQTTVTEPGIEDDELAQILGVCSKGKMTVAGAVMGTLEYMSPEQASGDSSLVGTFSDIFGLGATLFNVVTGDVAFEYEGTDPDSVNAALEEVKQGKIRQIDDYDSRVPKPLVAICRRAMAFRPADRYKTAGGLGRDVDAFLAGEQVSAYREPLVDRVARFVKRHRTLFTTLLGALLVGFVSLALATLMINRQKEKLAGKNHELANLNLRLAESIAIEKELTASNKQQLYETQMLLASEASAEPGGVGRMRQLVGRWASPDLESYRGWEWKHLDALGRKEFWNINLNATANHVIFTRDHANAQVFDAGRSTMFAIDADGKKLVDRTPLPRGVTSVDFNRDQTLMALGFNDGKVKVIRTKNPNAKPVEFLKLKSSVTDVRWNVGGDMLATCDESGELVVWQWYDRDVIGTGTGVLNQFGKRLLNWSYDGKQVIWTTGKSILGLNVATEKEEVLVRDDWIVSPSWSHEGKLLAYVGPENTIVVTDPKTKTTDRFKGHQLFVESLVWHPKQHYLLSASADGTVRIWNTDTKKQVRHLLGHSGHVYSAAWNPEGEKVVSGGLSGDRLRVWDVSDLGSEAFDRELQDHPAFDWHQDGSQLIVAENTDILLQNDLGETRWIRSNDSNQVEIFGIALDQTGKRIACVSRTGRIWTVDAQSGETIKVFDKGGKDNLFPDITSKGVGWSSDGRFLSGVGAGGKVRVWDTESGDDIAEGLSKSGKVLTVAWAPASSDKVSHLAFAGADNDIIIFDAAEQKAVNKITQVGWTTGIAWSPDGTKLACANRRNIDVWDTTSISQKLLGVCEGPSSMIWDLSWSNSQDRIAALTEDGKVCIWNAKTWAYSAEFASHERAPYTIRWSPNGKRLVSTARLGRIVFQDVSD